jgi:hypothetical protein
MPTYTGEDAWLFAGDDFDGCGSCGQSDCDGCDYVRPKWLPTTDITVIRTGAPTVLLFDNDSYQRQFVFGGDHSYDIPKLRRYDEVWERITPNWRASSQRGSGLKIRYLDHENKPMTRETEVSSVVSKFTVASTSHKFFALSVRRGDGSSYSLFGGDGENAWRLNLNTGERTPVTDLRIDGSSICYSTVHGPQWLGPDSIFDYGTGERIVHAPPSYSVMAKS